MQQSIPSYQQRDAHWMHQALLEAKKAAALGEIPVGAVIRIGVDSILVDIDEKKCLVK